MVTENSFCAADGDNKPADSTGIGGRILDEEKEPMVGMGAYVQVYQDGVVKGGAAVDEYGYYYVILPGPGIYDVKAVCSYYMPDTVKQVTVAEHTVVQLDFNLKAIPVSLNNMLSNQIHMGGTVPMTYSSPRFDAKSFISTPAPVKGYKKKKRR